MATFEIGRTLKTRESTISVDAGLPHGEHRFRLEVVRADGSISAPDEVRVLVTRREPVARRTPRRHR